VYYEDAHSYSHTHIIFDTATYSTAPTTLAPVTAVGDQLILHLKKNEVWLLAMIQASQLGDLEILELAARLLQGSKQICSMQWLYSMNAIGGSWIQSQDMVPAR
jgi:hypothetical protein